MYMLTSEKFIDTVFVSLMTWNFSRFGHWWNLTGEWMDLELQKNPACQIRTDECSEHERLTAQTHTYMYSQSIQILTNSETLT